MLNFLKPAVFVISSIPYVLKKGLIDVVGRSRSLRAFLLHPSFSLFLVMQPILDQTHCLLCRRGDWKRVEHQL